MKEQIKITKEKIIRDIARRTNNGTYPLARSIDNVKVFYNTLEDILFETLSSVNEEQDVCIKMFEGISLEGKYIPEKSKKNNLTGEINFVESKIKPKFNITRSYCEKLQKDNLI